MSATIYDLARELGLSHTTVSRVLRGRDDRFISEATKVRVREAAVRMGYRPSRSARALATGKTEQIGLLMRHLNSSHYLRVLRAIESEVRKTRFQVLMASLDMDNPDVERKGALAKWDVDGCLVVEALTPVLHAARQGEPVARHVVGIGGYDFDHDEVDYVGIDLRAGFRHATEYLIEIGRRQIAFLGRDLPNLELRDDRSAGYVEAMLAEGLEPQVILCPGETRQASRLAVAHRFAHRPAIDALICYNDDMAVGAYRGLRDTGLAVPIDVALIGCDGIEDLEFFDVPIATLAQPIAETARLGWEFLMDRVEHPAAPLKQTLLMPELVIRDSAVRSQ